MSTETIALIGVGATLLVAFVSAHAWGIRRMDAVFASLSERIDAQGRDLRTEMAAQGRELRDEIDAQGRGLRHEMAAQGEKLDARLSSVERELVELKVAVARIEGPRPHFSVAR